MDVVSSYRPGRAERTFRISGVVAIILGASLPWASATSVAGNASEMAPAAVVISAVVVVLSVLVRSPWGVRGSAVLLGGIATAFVAYRLPGSLIGSYGAYQVGLAAGAYVSLLGYFSLTAGLYEELLGYLRTPR